MLTLHALRIELGKSYRSTVDLLSEMPGVLDEIGLSRLPHSLIRRRLLISLSSCYRVEEDKGTASAVPDTNDSARCVWLGIGRSESVAAGSLA